MKYTGFYINLDRSPERQEEIEKELARNGLGGLYSRFAASDGNTLNFPNTHPILENELGCFTSHYRLLMENRDSPRPLHVIEDDILLSPAVETMLDELISNGELAKYDIIYTDVNIPVTSNYCVTYKEIYNQNVKLDKNGRIESTRFSIIDMKDMELASTCSMLINPRSIANLAELFEYELRRGARMPVDFLIRHLCNHSALKVGCLFPFVTSIKPENYLQTTIHSRPDVKTIRANHMLRHSFFIGADLNKLLAEAIEFYPQPDAGDVQAQLLLRLMGFSLTPEYKKS